MINWEKPIQTRDGRKARVVRTDVKSDHYSVICLVTQESGDEFVITCHHDGSRDTTFAGHEADIINAPEKRTIEGWVNVYESGHSGDFHSTKEYADATSGRKRIACVHVSGEYEIP